MAVAKYVDKFEEEYCNICMQFMNRIVVVKIHSDTVCKDCINDLNRALKVHELDNEY